jgi:hypothetical protein
VVGRLGLEPRTTGLKGRCLGSALSVSFREDGTGAAFSVRPFRHPWKESAGADGKFSVTGEGLALRRGYGPGDSTRSLLPWYPFTMWSPTSSNLSVSSARTTGHLSNSAAARVSS